MYLQRDAKWYYGLHQLIMVPLEKKSAQPLLNAGVVLFILLAAIVTLAIFVDFSNTDLRGLLLVTAVLSAIVIAKNVYDTTKAEVYRANVESNFAKNLTLASKELYTELYQNSPIPYLMIDFKGNIRSTNLAARRFLELPKEGEATINAFSRLISDEPHHLDLLIEKYQNRVAVSDETVRIMRKDGSEAWALLSLFHFASSTDHVGLLTLVDITKQKQIENAKSEFVSLASHQLRTPIAGIKWSAELLQLDASDRLTDRQKKYIDRLLSSAKRMALLVDDFLRVSRFELGTFQPEYKDVNLIEIIDDVITEHTERIAQKKITVKTFYDEAYATFTSDPNLLRMIVTNFFSNAVKYTGEGGTVHVGFGRKDDTLVISVADNGMGIPAADQDRIFSKLFRASNAVRTVPDGTGLGLYIVRQAVSVLGGTVNFTSTENMNTTFEVVLPLP